jgi:hypothetical protein
MRSQLEADIFSDPGNTPEHAGINPLITNLQTNEDIGEATINREAALDKLEFEREEI